MIGLRVNLMFVMVFLVGNQMYGAANHPCYNACPSGTAWSNGKNPVPVTVYWTETILDRVEQNTSTLYLRVVEIIEYHYIKQGGAFTTQPYGDGPSQGMVLQTLFDYTTTTVSSGSLGFSKFGVSYSHSLSTQTSENLQFKCNTTDAKCEERRWVGFCQKEQSKFTWDGWEKTYVPPIPPTIPGRWITSTIDEEKYSSLVKVPGGTYAYTARCLEDF